LGSARIEISFKIKKIVIAFRHFSYCLIHFSLLLDHVDCNYMVNTSSIPSSLHHQIYTRVCTFHVVIYKLFGSVFLSYFFSPSCNFLTCSFFLRSIPIPLCSRKTPNISIADTWTISALMLQSLKQINGIPHHHVPCLDKYM